MKSIFGLLLGFLLVSGCVLNAPPSQPASEVSLAFTPGQGSCATGEPEITVWSDSGALKFAGSILTPTPCYSLDASYKISGKIIEISIQKQPLGGVCIQCIGAVPFEGEITGLKEGDYRVKVFVDGKPLKEAEVRVMP